MLEIKPLSVLFKKMKPSELDDLVDKANYYVTTMLLAFLCIVVSAKQIYGEPITCMMPPEFPRQWGAYVNNYCLVTGTFVLDSAQDVMPQDTILPPDSMKIDVSYYQWVPYVLLVQAVFFYLPHFFWHVMRKQSSELDYKHVVKRSVEIRAMPVQDKKQAIHDLVEDVAKVHECRRANKSSSNGLGSASLLSYVAYKILSIVNVVVQIYFMHRFIGRTSGSPLALAQAIDGIYSSETGFFPRVSFCTFKQNALGGLHSHTVQCALMVNMLNEKIFGILHAWLLCLLLVSMLSACWLFFSYMSPVGFRQAAKRYLVSEPDNHRKDYANYADHCLGQDGLLLLRFIEINAGFKVASDVAVGLYDELRHDSSAIDNELFNRSLDTSKVGRRRKLDTAENKPLNSTDA